MGATQVPSSHGTDSHAREIDRRLADNDSEASHPDYSETIGFYSILWEWKFEFIVLLLSFGLLGAIFGVLSNNNDKLVMDWSLSGINLNTLVAVLSAFLRALILTIAEEANKISSYIYIGCLITVLSLSVGPFAQQAAGTKSCVKIIPSAKAQLPYTYEGVPYLLQQTFDWGIEPGIHNAIIRASSNSEALNSSSLLQGCPSGNCTFSTNSDGYSLSTLGVCSRCIDTTQYIQKLTNESSLVGIPDVVLLNMSAKSPYNMTLNSATSGASQSDFIDIDFAEADFDDDFRLLFPAAISNLTLIGMTSSGCDFKSDTDNITHCTPPSSVGFTIDYRRTLYPGISQFNLYSATCTFYWCMRYHESSAERSTLHENLVAGNPGFVKPGEGRINSNSRVIHNWKPKCSVGGEDLDLMKARYISNDTQSTKVALSGSGSEIRDIPDIANCTVRVDEQASQALRTAFGNLMGRCVYKPGAGIVRSLRQRIEHVDCDPVYLFGLMNDGLATFSSTANVMSVVATAITNRMREFARDRNFNVLSQDIGNQDRGGYVQGEAYETSICTDFQWKWLLGPTILLLMTVFFLIQSVSRSIINRNREPLWKASILPAIYASPGPQLKPDRYNLKGLENMAEKDFLTLAKTGKNKWEFLKSANTGIQYGRGHGDQIALMDLPQGSSERRLSI
ncbi:unnamed protein product [Clonostachys rosea]|uniref:Uncharacterized protein n=1 Tax=Bionectria ochroleuca TaxID=29856 RepID=A0ABY6U4X7_BIOOC|nr:unnamed protein product [Clonostachys rosea]